MLDKDQVYYWIELIQKELNLFKDIDSLSEQLEVLREKGLFHTLSIDGTGVFAYMISDVLDGKKILSEMIFYIKPEHRGKLKLVHQYIKEIELIAIDNLCVCVKIGANSNYKDKSMINLLRRLGYVDDTVSKNLS